MSLLIVDNVKKHFGALEVLRGASLRMDPGEKCGLVGENGGGKTTILRLIEGLDTPDWGSVTLRKGARLGHVPQRPQFDAGVTVRQYVEAGLEEARRALAELDRIHHAMDGAHGVELERLMKDQDRASAEVEALGAWETSRLTETVLSGIGLAEEFWDREARTLSGGEKSRTALARELVARHDLLLLDEPTNHLDLAGIEWIEAYIHEMKGAVLVVSHDRRLLNNAVSSIFELARGAVTRYSGNYANYVRLKEERFVSEMRAYESQQDFLRKEELFIKKHMGSQRTAEAKGREKKLSSITRLGRPFDDIRKPRIKAPVAERGGESVLEAFDLAGGYDRAKPLFKGVDLRVGRGERIGIVGANGAGKTTFLKILAGRMAPMAGRVELGHRAAVGYFDQENAELSSDSTPYGEIRRDHPAFTDLEIRNHLAKFLFRGNGVDASVGSLSGGERARLALAKLVLKQVSWFAMDEPTNHLDLAARTALEEMLGDFQGAMLFISHDREFLDGLCNRMLEVGDGRVRSVEGNYTAWRTLVAAEREASGAQRQAARAEERAAAKADPAPKPASSTSKPSGNKVRNPYLFEKLENRIIELETELKALQDSCTTEEVYRNPARLKETQVRIAEIERDLAVANHQWETWQ